MANPADLKAVPENIRAMAETSLGKAREAVDKYMAEASRLYETVDSSVQAAQAGARDLNRRAVSNAEANVKAAFDFAQSLVQAGSLQEIAQLQQKFVQQQAEALNKQMRELGDIAGQTVASARPKT